MGGGGVRKVPKKCHVLFEWPLNTESVWSMFRRNLSSTLKQGNNIHREFGKASITSVNSEMIWKLFN